MGNQFIRKLTIENYKSIKELKDFELTNINILIGANGAGKSNFLSFFNFIRNLSNKNQDGYVAKKGNADGIITFGRKQSEYLYAKIEFGENNENNLYSYSFKLEATDDNKFYFTRESFFENSVDFIRAIDGYRESKLDDIVIPQENSVPHKSLVEIVSQLKKMVQYHFHDTGDTSPIKSADYVFECEKLKFDGKNIAAFLRKLYFKYHECYKMIVSTISMIVPDFYDFHIVEDLKEDELTSLYWIHKNDRDSIQHPSFLSDGSLRFICLVTVLLQPLELMPDIIIIDEPELGLHPRALAIIAALIDRVSLQKQFIIATQSASFVDLFRPNDIIVVEKGDDGISSVIRQDEEKLKIWLDEYSMSDLWDMNLIGGRP